MLIDVKLVKKREDEMDIEKQARVGSTKIYYCYHWL